MVSEGTRLDLSFVVKAFVDGEPWEGPFQALVTRRTVVSVYMRNNTSSCDKQAGQLVEVEPELTAAGFGLIAVSRDGLGSHLKYAAKRCITFPLISDPECHFARAVDAMVEKKMYGRVYVGPARSTFLIDPSGEALRVLGKVEPSRHAQQLRELCGL